MDSMEEAAVAWFRRRGGASAASGRTASREDIAHLEQFALSRRGVEAFIEPRTAVTETTVILIAHDGEWTRRAAGSRDSAFDLARSLEVPVYDVLQTGYPNRMREWNSRQRKKP